MPWLRTTSEPPLETTVLLAVPPEETVSVPPKRTVATVMPRSVCEPPPRMVVPLATPVRLTTSSPATEGAADVPCRTRGRCRRCRRWRRLAVPPDRMLRVPPLRTSTPPLVWPEEMVRVLPLRDRDRDWRAVMSVPPLPSEVSTNGCPSSSATDRGCST